MTLGKSLALAMGFVVALAVGVWIGPYLTDRAGIGSDRQMRHAGRTCPGRKASRDGEGAGDWSAATRGIS